MSFPGELDRVADQVDHDLPDPERVAHDAVRQPAVDLAGQVEALGVAAVGRHHQRFTDAASEGEGGQLEFHATRVDLGEVEDVVEDLEEVQGGRLNGGEVVPLGFIQVRGHGEFGHPDDAIHRSPELVAHVGEEGPLGGCAFLREGLSARQGIALFLEVLDQLSSDPDGRLVSAADRLTSARNGGDVERNRRADHHFGGLDAHVHLGVPDGCGGHEHGHVGEGAQADEAQAPLGPVHHLVRHAQVRQEEEPAMGAS